MIKRLIKALVNFFLIHGPFSLKRAMSKEQEATLEKEGVGKGTAARISGGLGDYPHDPGAVSPYSAF